MKRTLTGVGLALAMLALGRNASAQVAKGDNEIGGNLTIDTGKYVHQTITDFDWSTYVSTTVFYAKSVTDRVSVGPSFNLTHDGTTTGLVGGFADYHFGKLDANMVPFIEVGAKAGFGDSEGSTKSVFGVSGGVKWFVNKRGGALVLSPYYSHFSYNDKTAFKSSNDIGLSVGISKFF